MTEDGILKMTQEQEALIGLITQGKPNWKLVRSGDGLTKHSVQIKWIEWNDKGTVKALHDNCMIGCSLLMSPFNQHFTWQTTEVTEIVEEKGGTHIVFQTKNSEYTLSRIYESTSSS